MGIDVIKGDNCGIRDAIISERDFTLLETLDSDCKRLKYYVNQLWVSLLKILKRRK